MFKDGATLKQNGEHEQECAVPQQRSGDECNSYIPALNPTAPLLAQVTGSWPWTDPLWCLRFHSGHLFTRERLENVREIQDKSCMSKLGRVHTESKMSGDKHICLGWAAVVCRQSCGPEARGSLASFTCFAGMIMKAQSRWCWSEREGWQGQRNAGLQCCGGGTNCFGEVRIK